MTKEQPQTKGLDGRQRAAYALSAKRKANKSIPDSTVISRQRRRWLERKGYCG